MIGGLFAGALTLIAVQVFTGSQGAERGGALLQWLAGGLEQLLAADKAAIPNLANRKPPAAAPAAPGSGSGSVGGPTVPATLPVNPSFRNV